MMRAWGADGIEMEDGNDFITIVCFSLRKIATEGAGIGRIFSCLKLVYCTLFIFIFYFIFYSSIHFETKKKKGRKKKLLVSQLKGRASTYRDLGYASDNRKSISADPIKTLWRQGLWTHASILQTHKRNPISRVIICVSPPNTLDNVFDRYLAG